MDNSLSCSSMAVDGNCGERMRKRNDEDDDDDDDDDDGDGDGDGDGDVVDDDDDDDDERFDIGLDALAGGEDWRFFRYCNGFGVDVE